MDQVILVDRNDAEIGVEEKLEAHQKGLLHRAFSVFVFDSKGRLLLQKRADNKYHSGGLWSNTCCSHPMPGENTLNAAHRRLKEEMGFDCKLIPVFNFIYKADVGNNLTEHEYDHVFVGEFDGSITPDNTEVDDWRWISTEELRKDIDNNSEKYTYWLKKSFEKILATRKN